MDAWGTAGSEALVGAGVGASIGSLFPGFGTVIGAAAGAVVGGVYGFITGSSADKANKNLMKPIYHTRQQTNGTAGSVGRVSGKYNALATTRATEVDQKQVDKLNSLQKEVDTVNKVGNVVGTLASVAGVAGVGKGGGGDGGTTTEASPIDSTAAIVPVAGSVVGNLVPDGGKASSMALQSSPSRDFSFSSNTTVPKNPNAVTPIKMSMGGTPIKPFQQVNVPGMTEPFIKEPPLMEATQKDATETGIDPAAINGLKKLNGGSLNFTPGFNPNLNEYGIPTNKTIDANNPNIIDFSNVMPDMSDPMQSLQGDMSDPSLSMKNQGGWGVNFAANGIKATDKPVYEVVDWNIINKGTVGGEDAAVRVSGKPVMASKGEIKVKLKGASGETDAILNRQQWNSYLNGRDINEILNELPNVNHANKAARGVIGEPDELPGDLNVPKYIADLQTAMIQPATFGDENDPESYKIGSKFKPVKHSPFDDLRNAGLSVWDKQTPVNPAVTPTIVSPVVAPSTPPIATTIVPRRKGSGLTVEQAQSMAEQSLTDDEMILSEYKNNIDTTKSVNFARGAASVGTAGANILHNSLINYDFQPVTPERISPRAVDLGQRSTENEKQDLQDAHVAALRMAMETGKMELIPAIYNAYQKGVSKVGQENFNMNSALKAEESKTNAQLGIEVDSRNAIAKADADKTNIQQSQWMAGLKDANYQKNAQSFSDILGTITTVPKLNADADLALLMQKYSMDQANKQYFIELLKTI